MDNLSGHGKFFETPEELKKWNWGAFWMTFIWGFYNEVFISFLIFVPGINLFVPFYIGLKGNEISWRNKRWDDEEQFLKTQKRWAIIGWLMSVVWISLFSMIIYNYVSVKNQDKYINEEAYRMISENQEAIDFIGDDFEIIQYIRGSSLIFVDTTYSIIVKTSRGKYWAAIRIDDEGVITEILLSHYYVIEGFHEVIIKNTKNEDL